MAFTPPDPEAVRRAIAPPANPARRRATVLLTTGGVFALIGAFLLPDNRKQESPSESETSTGEYVIFDNHDEGFRFLVPLKPDRSGRGTQLETMLVFGYSCFQLDQKDAVESIRKNWSAAATAVSAILRSCTRLDLINDLESVNGRVRATLDEVLFPDGIGQIQTIGWTRLAFS